MKFLQGNFNAKSIIEVVGIYQIISIALIILSYYRIDAINNCYGVDFTDATFTDIINQSLSLVFMITMPICYYFCFMIIKAFADKVKVLNKITDSLINFFVKYYKILFLIVVGEYLFVINCNLQFLTDHIDFIADFGKYSCIMLMVILFHIIIHSFDSNKITEKAARCLLIFLFVCGIAAENEVSFIKLHNFSYFCEKGYYIKNKIETNDNKTYYFISFHSVLSNSEEVILMDSNFVANRIRQGNILRHELSPILHKAIFDTSYRSMFVSKNLANFYCVHYLDSIQYYRDF